VSRWLALVALVACSSPPAPPIADRAPPSAPNPLEIDYETWGLMPAPRCGSPTFAIVLARDRTVSCGWRSQCPPYSEAAPLRPIAKGTLTDPQTDRLLALAGSQAFFALPTFNSNPHIIDGGEQQIAVRIGTRAKTVEMANTSAPAFDELLAALEATTGCSRESAGAPPR
jgi:hypothetical protein